jgi:hypothetical protein
MCNFFIFFSEQLVIYFVFFLPSSSSSSLKKISTTSYTLERTETDVVNRSTITRVKGCEWYLFYMMDVAVGQWETGQGSDVFVTKWLEQWDSWTQEKVVACVLHDGRKSGTVGHRKR